MIKQPPYLKKGDKIAIVSPAKYLPKDIDFAISLFKQWGLEVVLGESVYAADHQFAGSDELRTKDLQRFLDDSSIKAVIASRGGYGVIRIIDNLDFSLFLENPKWLVGFSDITVLLSHLFGKLNTQSIHAQMPYTFDDATQASLESLRKALFGESLKYHIKNHPLNRPGTAEGLLIGGNLTLLVMVQGSLSEMDYTDKILFIEDVGEREASIDRMMRMLKRSGKLSQLRGLIVGAFNEMDEEKVPFGQSPEEIIFKVVEEYNYPVCFQFPVGHIADNQAIILGTSGQLHIDGQQVTLVQPN
ncbi:LD-carboxypeptidase [Pedobacter sp. HMWF019]|uniref:S66 peptidase family protein n=1 Tax=Pedobacter sp. HMWF019 TaxID=2056856 RepID=UPI000D3C50EE|nr:LD-carboxypeptidase [Pedobacter sp. HMWF019]PTS99998.1 LD-carboxypeptidase [Pedobacter sp. HMWF019]